MDYTDLFKNVENKEQAIEALRKCFNISLAAFTCMYTMASVFGEHKKSIMHLLHEDMVNVLKEENPNENDIIVLLRSMEIQSEINKYGSTSH